MMLENIFIWILNMSLTGSLMILAVLLMRLFLRRAPKIFSYMLWLIVLFRLLCPISFESEFSLLNMLGVSSVGNGTVDFISESIGTEGPSGVESLFGNLNMSSESAGADDEIRAALQEGNTYENNRYGYAGQGGTTSEDGRRQGIQSETTNPNIIQQETEPGETMQDESGNSESMQPDAAGQAAAYEDTGRQGNMQPIDAQKSSDADNIESLGIWGILGLLRSSQIQSVFSVGSVIWLIGVAILMLYGFVSYVHLNRKLYRLESNELEAKESDSKGIELNEPAADNISAIKNRIRIYRCNNIPTAFVLGLFRPRIYLPANLEETEERYILLHEQVHIKRGDSLYRTIAYLALCLHWFNPLVWLAFHLSGMDMEMSCDEAVIRQIGSGIKKEYSQTLLALATGSSMVKGIPLAFGEGDTGSRIKNVLGYKKPTVILVAVVLVLCLGTAIFLLGNPIRNEQEDRMLNQISDQAGEEQNDDSAGNSDNLTDEQQENRVEDEIADTEGAEDDGIYYTMDEIKALDIPEDMLAYWLVLNSKMPFVSYDEGSQEFYWDEYYWFMGDPVRSIYPIYGRSDDECLYWGEPTSYIIVDMDNDGNDEIVLYCMGGSTRILHYEDGSVYSYQFPWRGMSEIRVNGIYEGSGGASNHSFHRFTELNKDGYTIEKLSEMNAPYSYEIGGEEVAEDEYWELLDSVREVELAEEIVNREEGILGQLSDYLLEGLSEEEIYMVKHVAAEPMTDIEEYSMDSEVMQAYYEVLTSEKEFISVTDQNQRFYLDTYRPESWTGSYEKADYLLYFSIVDMDGDGIYEVVLTSSYNKRQILHYENGNVYSYIIDSYGVMDILTKQGIFDVDHTFDENWNYVYQCGRITSFNEDGFVIEEIDYTINETDYKGNTNGDRVKYYYFSKELIDYFFLMPEDM